MVKGELRVKDNSEMSSLGDLGAINQIKGTRQHLRTNDIKLSFYKTKLGSLP